MAEFLNKNIKYLRTIKKISQQDLADKIGVNRSTVSRIENGEIETTIENAINLANALDVSLNDLITKDLRIENVPKKEMSEEEELKMLTDTLKKKGFLDENEKITEEDFNTLINFAKANKQFIMKEDK